MQRRRKRGGVELERRRPRCRRSAASAARRRGPGGIFLSRRGRVRLIRRCRRAAHALLGLRDDGKLRWLTDLPRYDDPEKRRDPLFWTGPILAGGRLVLAGSNSTALSVNPANGKIIGRQDLRGAAAVTPVAAAGTLFILTDDGSLQAFR